MTLPAEKTKFRHSENMMKLHPSPYPSINLSEIIPTMDMMAMR
jgi:hypothetical protein